MSTLDEIAGQVSAVIDGLDNAARSMTACVETLDSVVAVLTTTGVHARADATTAARNEVDRILTMLAQLRGGAEQLRQSVLALKHGPTGAGQPSVARPQPQALAPAAVPDPGARRRIEELALRADHVLLAGGVNPADVYGTAPADTPHRVGLTRSLLDNAFPKRVRDRLLPWALHFAADRPPGRASDPATVTRRYEYAKAIFSHDKRQAARDLEQGSLRLDRGQSLDKIAADRATRRDLHAQLDRDVQAARRLGGEPAVVNPTAEPAARAAAVKRAAERVQFTDELAAVCHARKHARELPDTERFPDVVTGYYTSARRTIREGHCNSADAIDQGRTRLVFHRTASRSDGSEIPVEAVVFVRPSGLAVLATYGHTKEARTR